MPDSRKTSPAAPLIDDRTLEQIISQTEALVELYTSDAVLPSALAGRILAQNVEDPASGQVLAKTGAFVDPALAGRIAGAAGLGPVRIRGWQNPRATVIVPPLPALLTGRTLAEDVRLNAGAAVPAGTVLDPSLAEQIGRVTGLQAVSVFAGRDMGAALVRIFARLAEVVITRLNQVPEKNFLAFLNLLGVELLPPQPARVPLTFTLAAGSAGDAIVPAGTPVAAAPLEGDTAPVIFETEQELVVTATRLTDVFSREPGRDLYRKNSATAFGQPAATFSPFRGSLPIPHAIYLGHFAFFSPNVTKAITLSFGGAAGSQPWLAALKWSYWEGAAFVPLAAAASIVQRGGERVDAVVLPAVPGIPQASVAGASNAWLYGQLNTSLPRGSYSTAGGQMQLSQEALPTDAVFRGSIPLDPDEAFYPFLSQPNPPPLYLASDEAFSKPGARVTLAFTLDDEQPAAASNDLVLAWHYWSGTRWLPLGSSTPTQSASAGSSNFKDDTFALTRSGAVAFDAPADIGTGNGADGPPTSTQPWIRVTVQAGRYERPAAGVPDDRVPPAVTALSFSYKWTLPRIERADVSIAIDREGLAPDQAFAGPQAVDLSKSFLPFGEKPKFNDTLWLASQEIFGVAGAAVTLNFTVDNPRRPQVDGWPVTPVNPSPDLVIAWEAWNGHAWDLLGEGRPLPGAALLDPYVTWVDAGEDVELGGQAAPGLTVEIEEKLTGTSALQPKVSGERWTATQKNVDVPGVHVFLVTLRQRGKVLETLWAPVVVTDPTAGDRPPALTIRIEASADSVRLGGMVSTTKATLLVANARTGEVVPDIDPADGPGGGRFSARLELAAGRNDILVLASVEGKPVAAEVVSVARPIAGSSFSDTTYALTASGQVTFTLPGANAAGAFNSVSSYWVRARVLRGNYGVEASYREMKVDQQTVYVPVPATFAPPSTGGITLDYTFSAGPSPLEAIVADNDFVLAAQSPAAAFTPFTPAVDTEPALYLAFRPPGAGPALDKRATTLYFSVQEPIFSSVTAGSGGAGSAGVSWEYWDGGAWARLGTRDDTEGFTRRGLVTFVGPADFAGSVQFGQSAYWLRGRWMGLPAAAALPVLGRVLTNTTWATNAVTIQNEILGTSSGERDQLFRTARTPVLAGQQLLVREPEMPSASDRELLAAEGGDDGLLIVPAVGQAAPAMTAGEVWVRWRQVPDFYASGPRSRHYTFDPLAGAVHFGDGQRGLIPPQGRANIVMSRYRTGGGAEGNRPADNVRQLKSTVPYIDGVTNIEPAAGGSAAETLEAAKARGPKTLRHRGRAVALADYEDLAMQSSSEVALVKGVSAPAGSSPGAVGLIVVPRSSAAKPMPSVELLGRVDDYVTSRMPPTANLWVAEPDWVQVTVTAEIVPVSAEKANDVQTLLLARLAAFLHPLTGGLDSEGWPFGRKPYRSDLFALVEATPGVDHVLQLSVDEQPDGGRLAGPDRFLVYSGNHQITMVS